MDIKILIATHKKYDMPKYSIYQPIHVGREGKAELGYKGDNTGVNISMKNSYFCELTGLYWGWKNLECNYVGLAHYRRHFSDKNIIYRFLHDKNDSVLNDVEAEKILSKYDAIVPKKRKYYIETLYSHYAHTHYAEHLDITREIIEKNCSEYLDDFDHVMNQRSGYMFNMFVMKKELSDKYCEWLFNILSQLENEIDIKQYDAFQARLFGRVSELLFNVWIRHENIKCKEINFIYMEKINWSDKIISFLKAKFEIRRFEKSF